MKIILGSLVLKILGEDGSVVGVFLLLSPVYLCRRGLRWSDEVKKGISSRNVSAWEWRERKGEIGRNERRRLGRRREMLRLEFLVHKTKKEFHKTRMYV